MGSFIQPKQKALRSRARGHMCTHVYLRRKPMHAHLRIVWDILRCTKKLGVQFGALLVDTLGCFSSRPWDCLVEF